MPPKKGFVIKEGVAFATCAICLAPQMTPTGEGSMPTITLMEVQTSEGQGLIEAGLFTFLGDVNVDVNYIWEM